MQNAKRYIFINVGIAETKETIKSLFNNESHYLF
jgi:hypothetical protein